MRINLLPPEYRPQPLINPLRLTLMIAGGLLSLVSLAFTIFEFSAYQSIKGQLEDTKLELKSYDRYKEQLKQIDAMRFQVETYQKELHQFESIYQPHLVIVDGIAASLSRQIWLSHLAVDTDGNIKMRGESLDFALIGDLLEELSGLERIQSCKLEKITEIKDEILTSYSFEITLKAGRAQGDVSK